MGGERFADLLRRHRHRAGFSQDDLAERSGLSTRAISDLERGVKLRPYPETVRQLASALDLTGEPLVEFRLAASNRSPEPPSPGATPPDTAPGLPQPLTPLIGREDDLAALSHLLQPDGEVRLVTLTGAGGVGKSCLGLQIAHELAARFDGRASFIELAAVTDPAQVIPAMALHLGVREHPERTPLDSLIRTLQESPRLLVLDNLEQVIGAAPDIARLLEGCPHLRILATSRAPLRISGEREFPVLPLAPPDPNRTGSPDLLLRYPAVRLFVARAQAVDPAFTVTPDNARDVATICHAVDGLPLALELAAVRMKTLTPADLVQHLGQRLNVLNRGPQNLPRRHQALRETIAWSYQLLTPEQQETFAAFSIFVGGATLDAVAAILCDGDTLAALDAMTDLLDQSLLIRTEDASGMVRFQMLETIREFAAERLAESGAHGDVAQHHANHFLIVAEDAYRRDSVGPDIDPRRIERDDYGNYRRALQTFVDQQEADRSQRLAIALWPYWAANGQLREGRAWLERTLAIEPRLLTPLRGDTLLRAGNIALDQSDLVAAVSYYEQSVAILENGDDTVNAAGALMTLGLARCYLGYLDAARQACLAALDHFLRMDIARGVAAAQQNLGLIALSGGDLAAARTWLTESQHLRERERDRYGLGYSLCHLGLVELAAGNVDLAEPLLRQSVTLMQESDDLSGIAMAHGRLAGVALRRDDIALALEFLAIATAVASDEEPDDNLAPEEIAARWVELLAADEQWDECARALAALDSWYHRTHFAIRLPWRAERQQVVQKLHDQARPGGGPTAAGGRARGPHPKPEVPKSPPGARLVAQPSATGDLAVILREMRMQLQGNALIR